MAFTVPSAVTIGWVGTNASIPAGWTRVTSLDSRFVKTIPNNATNPGVTGGSATHTHPFGAHSHSYTGHNHAGSWGTSGLASSLIDTHPGTFGAAVSDHTHTSSSATAAAIATSNNATPVNTDAASTNPDNCTVIFIQSDGTPTGIPVNGVIWFNGAAPTGFQAYTNLDNRLMVGSATGGDGGAQGGAPSHTHTSATHSHPIGGTHVHVMSLDVFSTTGNSDNNGPRENPHGHTLGNSDAQSNPANSDTATETSGTGDSTPAWRKMRAVQKITSVAHVHNMIGMWLGSLASIPADWGLCDGTLGTPNLSQNTYVRAAAADGEVGNTGGLATHTHAAGTAHAHASTGATHTHSFTATSGAGPGGALGAPTQTSYVAAGHTHSGTYTSTTTNIGSSTSVAAGQNPNTANDPLFTTVAYIQFFNTPPDAPTLNFPAGGPEYDLPATLTLDATVTDPDLDSVFAAFEYDRNDNAWVVIGNGTTVASGAHSTYSWSVTTLGRGPVRVRTRANDGTAFGPYTTSGVFFFGPGIELALRRQATATLVRSDGLALKRQATPKLTRQQE